MSSMRIFVLLSVVAVMVAALGCGSGGAPAKPASEADAAVQGVTDLLQVMATSGIANEESMAEAKFLAEELKSTDSAKADAVLTGLDEIKGLSSPEEIKAKAKEILSSL